MRSYRTPHSFKRRKSVLRNRFFWLLPLLFVLLYGVFYFFFLSSFFQIKEVTLTGEKKVAKENLLAFIPLGNIFLVDLPEIKETVLDKFPQLSQIEIKRAWPDSLAVVVLERKEMALWLEGEKYFLLDGQGIIFELVEAETKPALVEIENKLGFSSLGDKVIEEEEMTQILGMSSVLSSDLKVEIDKFIISSQDKLIALALEGWEIYFDLQGDIDWQLTKLRAVLQEKIPPEKRADLEYIELRFGNFAPYKYK